MRSLNDFEKAESRLDRELSANRLFSGLPQEIWQEFGAIKYTTLYPRGTVLFVEGQVPHGIYMLGTGRAKLSVGSRAGKTVITRIAEPGELLGLSATISDKPYEATVETLTPCRTDFVKRDDFLAFLREHREAYLRIAHHLSDDYHDAYERVRSLALSKSAAERLAKLLLGWCEKSREQTGQGIRLTLPLTHEEIAQMIGASRETVTRLLSSLRNREIVHVRGSTLLIRNKAALEAITGS